MIEIRNLSTEFRTGERVVKAVRDVSFRVEKGEILSIVGESGCGKSVTLLSIMGLLPSPPGLVTAGEVLFDQKNLLELPHAEMRKIRGDKISMIFQEPMTSLNPVFRIGDQISEVFRVHRNISRREAWQLSIEMLSRVGLSDPEERASNYPHQLSGGMCQRVMIAMALACEPDILLADEPTTALDVTVQAQILDLLRALRDDFGMAVVLITHDLGVVADIADRVIVMYGGKIVEEAECMELFDHMAHPYTIGLFRSRPGLNMKKELLPTIKGEVPELYNIPRGCIFAPRCDWRAEVCLSNQPPLKNIETGHKSACFRTEEVRGE